MILKTMFRAAALAALACAMPAAAQDAHETPAFGLAADGVTLTDTESEDTDLVGFGTSQDDTVAFVGRALGEPLGSGVNEQCPRGPLGWVRFQGDLMLYFTAGEFSGWGVLGDSGYETGEGLRLGTSWSEMTRMFDEVEGESSAIGYEFKAGGYGGQLSESGDAGTVTAIWAGTDCVVR